VDPACYKRSFQEPLSPFRPAIDVSQHLKANPPSHLSAARIAPQGAPAKYVTGKEQAVLWFAYIVAGSIQPSPLLPVSVNQRSSSFPTTIVVMRSGFCF
jgi:hypothetical protein